MIKVKKRKILLLPGDGIGPEVIAEVKKILEWLNKNKSLDFEIEEGLVGGISYDKHKNPITDEVFYKALESEAVILGAVGGPKWDNLEFAKRPERALLKLRKELKLFANLRPAICFKQLVDASSLKPEIISGLDIMIVRELTGGIYFGERGRKDDGNTAFDTMTYTRAEIQRLAKKGFELAMTRGKKLCCVDKANVLESSRLWRETVQAMEKEYPEVTVSYEFVDAVAMRLVQWPNAYDVMITENLFGDILTDEASVISGSMGLMPSASVGETTRLYEPIHGSYPQAAGKDIANPLATVLSAAMMFEDFGLTKEAQEIRDVVNKSLAEGVVTEDLAEGGKAFKTSEVGDWLAENI